MKTRTLTLVAELTPNPALIPALHEAGGRFYAVGRSGVPEILSLGQALRLRSRIERELAFEPTAALLGNPSPLAKLLEQAANALEGKGAR